MTKRSEWVTCLDDYLSIREFDLDFPTGLWLGGRATPYRSACRNITGR